MHFGEASSVMPHQADKGTYLRDTTLALVVLAFCFVGCAGLKKTADATALRSEREYSEGSERLAQDLYNMGQAPSIEAARAQAAAATNQEWGRAAKATERKQDQEKFEKDLAKLDSSQK